MQLTYLSIEHQRQIRPRAGTHPLVSMDDASISSLYIHIPFCFHKCHYCDFYSLVTSPEMQVPFLDRLESELKALSRFAGPLKTIFIGGGTPTLLDISLWKRLLVKMHEFFDLDTCNEFTVECNPETVSEELLEVLQAGGVNRLSIGAQSFNPRFLATLEREHNPDSVIRSLDLAHKTGFTRLSLDLIFAIPGQTLTDWDKDLQMVTDLETSHLSCYCLTYEPGTLLWKRREQGQVRETDEEVAAEMYRHTVSFLKERGFHRYEISNFSLNGQECLHNLVYWRGGEYLAAGPSASGHLNGWRWKNEPDLRSYFDSTDLSSVVDVEPPDEKRTLVEKLMLGLRLNEGVKLNWPAAVKDRLTELAAEGLLEISRDNRIRLTETGFLQCDTVTADLMSYI